MSGTGCHRGTKVGTISPFTPTKRNSTKNRPTIVSTPAIVDPNRDVSPLYQTTQVVTGSGRTISGQIVYESPDGTLIQTSPDVTVRVAGDEIVAMRKSRLSLMPTGLLNDVTDAELADLFAHLKTLRGKR